ncbi:Protein of unknown function [Pyronema omphalodes CBS 100304]|uniref:Uncharacterized protein n=1 Tax=Pyronema omphalodes (strain CBS 100304) TaxID=1076935 RepID=U4L3J3_PYROM|nr:Protein of unknown function [Pyronema omphalodes CBS 100304]
MNHLSMQHDAVELIRKASDEVIMPVF